MASVKAPPTAAPSLLCGCRHIIKVYRTLSTTDGKEMAGKPLLDALLVPECLRMLAGWHKSNSVLEEAVRLSTLQSVSSICCENYNHPKDKPVLSHCSITPDSCYKGSSLS